MNGVAIAATCFLMIRDVNTLLAFRLVQGCCIGFYSVFVPLLIRELAPIEIYGSLGAIHQFFNALGIFFVYAVNPKSSSDRGEAFWVFIFLFPLIPILIQTALLLKVFNY